MDISAPGTNITSSYATSGAGTSDYPADPNFKIRSISGTSMSAPQVCGVGALYLQSEPNLTPAELKAKIIHDSKLGLLHDVLSWDQRDLDKYHSFLIDAQRGLFGAPNRVLYNRFVGDVFVQYVTSGGD